MKNNYFLHFKPGIIIGFILILGFGVYSANLYFQDSFGITLSVISIMTALMFVFNKFLWRHKPFKWLLWTPVLQGRYDGEIKFIHKKTNKEIIMPTVMVIMQTASSIKVNSFFKNPNGEKSTHSESKVASIVKEEDDTFSLIFTYENKGTPGNIEFAPHYGTNFLKLIENGKEKVLTGYYYTNRNPQTKGEITVKYKNNNLNHEF